MSTSPRRLELDDNSLAAFLDGTLPPAEREIVAARIADDPGARLVLLEAARCLEEAPQDRSWEPTSTRRLWTWMATAAATVLLALAVPDGPKPTLDADWSAILSAATDMETLAGHVSGGDESPVLAFAPGSTAESRSFRLGQASLDLEVLLRAGRGRSARADDIVVAALALMDDARRSRLANVAAHLLYESIPASADRLNAALRTTADDRRHFALGRWAEASRLAAAAGSYAYFEGDPFQAALEAAREGQWSEETRIELRRATASLATDPPDLRGLELSFEQIERLY